jgi:hypothetical protein|tara:strand:- start:315 stop:470 length:156 start_codon:yes stop_codon:yes gene_type:complete
VLNLFIFWQVMAVELRSFTLEAALVADIATEKILNDFMVTNCPLLGWGHIK